MKSIFGSRPKTLSALALVNIALGAAGMLYPFVLSVQLTFYSALHIIPVLLGLDILVQRPSITQAGVITLVGILFTVGILIMTHSRISFMREGSMQRSCISNLMFIMGAKEQWAYQAHATNGAYCVTNEVARFFKGDAVPWCPVAGKSAYTLGRVGEEPKCSIHGELYSF